jgi:hypothetical protein
MGSSPGIKYNRRVFTGAIFGAEIALEMNAKDDFTCRSTEDFTGTGEVSVEKAGPAEDGRGEKMIPLPERSADRRRTAPLRHPRLTREALTLERMVRMYCLGIHGTAGAACAECGALLEYARGRLAACVYGARKPTCEKCPVHCFSPRRREEARGVMRYAGPRMLWRHPVLAVRHLLDGWAGPRPRRERTSNGRSGRGRTK